MPLTKKRLEELADLAERICEELAGGAAARRCGLERYHAAGRFLLEAKQKAGHSRWGDWLKKNIRPEMTERTAERYMKFAKIDVTSETDLEAAWKRINGNDRTKGKKTTSLPNDGREPFSLGLLSQEEAADLNDRLGQLMEAWGLDDASQAAIRAIREAAETLVERNGGPS